MSRDATSGPILNLAPNLANPDGFYEELMASQQGMSETETALMNCKLILILTNHIGDRGILSAALSAAGGKAG